MNQAILYQGQYEEIKLGFNTYTLGLTKYREVFPKE